ncbi:hypothetical protein COLO4_28193 [Corchorus olitorius]|uniref:Uncharacterized protein n=1 Tax=Corchorus olitorius TaxID=93759 RepID=A0A1R3HML4_9ROSI|nr:hypothetical protein COLO4_28193 [Corchorus olitorius]
MENKGLNMARNSRFVLKDQGKNEFARVGRLLSWPGMVSL